MYLPKLSCLLEYNLTFWRSLLSDLPENILLKLYNWHIFTHLDDLTNFIGYSCVREASCIVLQWNIGNSRSVQEAGARRYRHQMCNTCLHSSLYLKYQPLYYTSNKTTIINSFLSNCRKWRMLKSKLTYIFLEIVNSTNIYIYRYIKLLYFAEEFHSVSRLVKNIKYLSNIIAPQEIIIPWILIN